VKIHSIRSAAAALSCASLLAFAALSCSKESEGATPTTAKTPPAASAPSKTIPVDQKVLEDAKAKSDSAAKKIGDPVKAAETKLGADGPKKLRFSAIPNKNTTEMLEKNQPLAAYLSKKLGIEVEYVPLVDYSSTVIAFTNGDLDMCWFGGYTGCQARSKVPGAQAIVCGTRDKKFKSYFIANKSMGWTKGDDFPMQMKGHKFTFGSDSSTSGRLMPEYFIRHYTKMSPKEFFGAEPAFSKNHDETLALVAAGTFECGVLDYTVYDTRVKEGKVKAEDVPIIWISPEYFDYQFTVRPDIEARFGAGFVKRLTDTLTGMSGDDLKLLGGIGRESDHLVTCSNEDFEKLRQTAVEIGLLR
jgi:phosphonate transport system substrate-binding protein